MAKLRKTFVLSIAIVTVLSMSLFAVPFEAGAAAQAGDLIKMDGLSSVYYLGADGQRYVFPNETTYFSWYADFSSVVTIPQSELESYPLGSNVVVRPGTWLVKITTDPKVYAVAPNGVLHWVPDEATALALYGADWASRIKDVPDAFFTNYDTSGADLDGTAYPEGSLVQFGTADVYYIANDGTARKVADEAAFLANGWKWDDIISATIAMPTAGTEITGAEGDVTDTSQGGGGGGIVPGAGTGLTAAIASDTPAAANIPPGSPNAFLKINVTASNDGPVNINSIKLNAYDLGTATNIENITFYKDGVKQGNSSNMSSDRYKVINFSSPIVVPAGTTVSLLVKANIAAAATGGNYALGLAAAANITTDGATVSGTFPIIGNTQAVVDADIGAATVSNVDGTDTTGVEFGEDDVLLASFTLAATNEPIIWETAMFRNGGTNNDLLFDNFKLVVDGDEIADGTFADRYVTFMIDNYIIDKGDSISVEVFGDAGIGNVGDSMALYIKDQNDFGLVGQDFGYGISLTDQDLLDTSTEGKTVTLTSGDVTLDVDKAATPAKDVRAGDDDVVIATIKLTSNGENATINDITNSVAAGDFFISGTNPSYNVNEIFNVELYDTVTGTTYDITTTATTTGWTLAMADEISLVKGVTKTFQLRADLGGSADTNEIEEGDTLKLTIKSSAISITGDESDADLQSGITPSSASGAVMTVKAASLTWTTVALTNKTVVPGATGEVVYRAGVKAGDSSFVDITSVKISADDTNFASFDDNNISSLDLYRVDTANPDGVLMKSKSNAIVNDHLATAYVLFNSLPASTRRVAAGEEIYLELRATFASTFSPTGAFELEIGHATDDIVCDDKDNNNVAESVVSVGTDSRMVTLATAGTLKVELDVNDNDADVDTYILAGSETTADRYLGMLKLTTTNEDVKIKTLVLGQNGTANGSDIKRVYLYDEAGAVVASVAPTASGYANFDSLNVVLDGDNETKWYIGVEAKSINADSDPEGTATYRNTIIFNLASSSVLTSSQINASANEAVTASGMDSGEDIDLTEASGVVGSNQYENFATTTKQTMITGSVLTALENDFDDSATLSSGGDDTIIGQYKVVFDNGANRTGTGAELKAQLGTMVITISTSTNTHIPAASVQAYLASDPGTKTTGVAVVAAGTATIDMSGLDKIDGEDTIVIEADLVVGGTNTSEHIQTKWNTLSSDFAYNGNDGSGTALTGPRLDITDLTGGKLYR